MMPAAAAIPTRYAVQNTAELQRVIALPRRTWSEADAVAAAKRLTAALRTPTGTMELRPIQAIALAELTRSGLVTPIRTGGGKTLVSLLAAVDIERAWSEGIAVARARRPLLLVPAKLKEKTIREWHRLAAHWRIPNHLRVESYELLGRVQAAELLNEYQPDLIILDEAHRAKNRNAACTRRLLRYLSDGPCRLVVESGTIATRSANDYAHLVQHALGAEHAPFPRDARELAEWADAMDEKPHAETRTGTGALVAFCNAEEAALYRHDPITACRKAFRRRLVETPGIVATEEGFLGCSLSITRLRPKVRTENELARVRGFELPDGTPLATGIDVWRHARELAIGFFYKWDPPPPRPWLEARKAWAAVCRQILSDNRRGLDSELHVANFLDHVEVENRRDVLRTDMYAEGIRALAAWRSIRDTFKPNTVPVWIDDGALNAAAKWAKESPGIVWTEHVAFAEGLAQCTGMAYFAAKGQDRRGVAIEDVPADCSIIASIAANAEGRNLQAWSRNLIVSPPPNGRTWEQLLARTHRDGQEADEVTFDVFGTCPEHEAAFAQAMRDARYIETTWKQAQKLLYADVTGFDTE